MYLQNLNPAHLEAVLEAAPPGTTARVVTAEGETLHVQRVPGGWYLPGDVVVTSGDIAQGQPRAVSLLRGDDGLALLADLDAEDAADVQAWRDSQKDGR